MEIRPVKRKKLADTEDNVLCMTKEFSLDDVDLNVLNSKNLLDTLLCSICTMVSVNPHMIQTCQHTFCKSCIDQHSSEKRGTLLCPICRGEYNSHQIVPNMLHVNILDNLQVKCLHKSCSWKGPNQSLKPHLRDGCEQLHMCDCFKIIEKNEKEKHEEKCPLLKIACKCGFMVERGKFDEHVREQCGDVNIACEFKAHGCYWTGLRKEYQDSHQHECRVRKLYMSLVAAKKNSVSPGEDIINKLYKKSDVYIVSGLIGDEETRVNIVRKFVKSKLDLKMPIQIGKPAINGASYEIAITAVEITGIFDIDSKKVKNKCVIDIDLKESIMVITFSGNKDRFFIIPTKYTNPTVQKSHGGRISIRFNMIKNKLIPSPMIYAHRQWLTYKEPDSEYPFTIEPSSRYITKFNLLHEKGSIDNTILFNHLSAFFSLPTWGAHVE